MLRCTTTLHTRQPKPSIKTSYSKAATGRCTGMITLTNKAAPRRRALIQQLMRQSLPATLAPLMAPTNTKHHSAGYGPASPPSRAQADSCGRANVRDLCGFQNQRTTRQTSCVLLALCGTAAQMHLCLWLGWSPLTPLWPCPMFYFAACLGCLLVTWSLSRPCLRCQVYVMRHPSCSFTSAASVQPLLSVDT